MSSRERAVDVVNLEDAGDDHDDDLLDLNSLKQEIFLKLLVLGDLGVGKTSLVKRYTNEGSGIASSDYKVCPRDLAFHFNIVQMKMCTRSRSTPRTS